MKILNPYISGLLLLALLVLTACDRFEHEFAPPVQTNFEAQLFTPLETAFNAGGIQSLPTVMSYFSDDYLHNGFTKQDRQSWLEGIYTQVANPVVEVTLINSQQTSATSANANWRLLISTPGRAVLADSTFTGDTLIKSDAMWQIRGNRAACSVPDPKQTVILEYFTFLGCPNCPPVEAKLHELQLEHIGRLSYLEHHTTGPLMVNGDPTYSYYAPGSVPVTMFQGETRIAGSGADVIASYGPLVDNLLEIDSPMLYQNLQYSISGQSVSGSIGLQPTQNGFTQDDLYLCAVLIEKQSSFTNTQGEHLMNVVRGKSIVDLRTADLSQPISFNVAVAGTSIPDDPAIVIFAQRRPATFANNASILSGIEMPLNISQMSKRNSTLQSK